MQTEYATSMFVCLFVCLFVCSFFLACLLSFVHNMSGMQFQWVAVVSH